ncbi:MAG: YdcF family protein [Phycisphaerae bacterium]|nr:YdcF family protein [Phycisphaerae bacterium]
METQKDLIIVPGHGVCKAGLTTPNMALLDSSWVGIFPGEGPFYVAHAERGVRLAAEKASALLVFSGGQTREDAGPRSEAEGYLEIAKDAGWWDCIAVKDRAVKEEYARDSFENLLFGLALFRQHTGNWPNMVTVCGWKFKEKRYSLHRQALKWPKKQFRYFGVNDPTGDELPKALAGEKAKVESVSRDLFLVGSEWVAQRELRDPFHRMHPYRGIDRDLDGLFDFLDRNTFTGKLPWLP